MKYLVDGASFVISKMHFNPENNYYITLGLPRNATHEELSRRWKKCMLLYHPDKQVGNEEWVSERAKKVNEAYTALKDEAKRAEYDHKLTEQTLSRNFPSAPSHGSTHHNRPSKPFSRHRSSRPSSVWSSIRPYATKILMAVYIFIALIVFGLIYIQNRSSHLEAELVPEPEKTDTSRKTETPVYTAQNTPAVEKQTPKMIPAVPVKPEQDPLPISQKAIQSPAAPSALQTIQNWFRPSETKKPQEKSTSEAIERNTALLEKNTDRVQNNASRPAAAPSNAEQLRKEDLSQQRAEIQKVQAEQRTAPAELVKPPQEVKQQFIAQPKIEQIRREDPPQQRPEVQKAPAQQQAARTEPVKPVQEARLQAASHPKTEQISKEEVEEFMRRYVRAYSKNDLETFLSLFSRSAVENNSLTYNEIRNAYKELFREKINFYKVNEMDIRTDGQTATVSGIYNLNRYFSEQDRWIRYSGKIAWKLVRENNQLRIISATYDQ